MWSFALCFVGERVRTFAPYDSGACNVNPEVSSFAFFPLAFSHMMDGLGCRNVMSCSSPFTIGTRPHSMAFGLTVPHTATLVPRSSMSLQASQFVEDLENVMS